MKTAYIPMNEQALERVKDSVFFSGKINEKNDTIKSQEQSTEKREKEFNVLLESKVELRREIDRLKSELAETKDELESETSWAASYHDELELKTEAALELERKFKEANKENLYLKRSFIKDASEPLEKCIAQAKQLARLDMVLAKERNRIQNLEKELKKAKKGGV